MTKRILLVCGLTREAELVREPAILAVAGGGHGALLERRLEEIDPGGVSAVVSFGLAGGLGEGLRAGDLVCPHLVGGPGRACYATDPEMRAAWRRLLVADLPAAPATLAGVDEPVLDIAGKRRLAATSGAVAVDMESHLAGAFAARHGLPFAVLRAISDTASQALPAVAATAMRPDGSIDVWGVARGVARAPGQIPALIRTAREAGRAFRTLGRVRGLLGPRLGLHL